MGYTIGKGLLIWRVLILFIILLNWFFLGENFKVCSWGDILVLVVGLCICTWHLKCDCLRFASLWRWKRGINFIIPIRKLVHQRRLEKSFSNIHYTRFLMLIHVPKLILITLFYLMVESSLIRFNLMSSLSFFWSFIILLLSLLLGFHIDFNWMVVLIPLFIWIHQILLPILNYLVFNLTLNILQVRRHLFLLRNFFLFLIKVLSLPYNWVFSLFLSMSLLFLLSGWWMLLHQPSLITKVWSFILFVSLSSSVSRILSWNLNLVMVISCSRVIWSILLP